MANVTFLGHASLKFKTDNGTVIYVDPFFKGDYSEQCNILLITHGHHDHMGIDKVNIAPGCHIVMPEDAQTEGEYQSFVFGDVKVTAVQAYNKNHKSEECVGYVLELDGKKIYCAGDTSATADMDNKLPKLGLDYAFLPVDGVYNMGPKEASHCAKVIKTKVAFPIHNDPQSTKTFESYDTNLAEFEHPGKVVLKHGETYTL